MPVVDQSSPVTTSEQQAVPVAQELVGFTLGMNVRIRDGVQHFGGLTGNVEKIHEASPRQYPIEVMLTDRKDSRCFRPHELEVIPLPCKSGEGAGRERIAQIIRGHMPSHWCDGDALRAEAFSTALADAIVDATQTREAEFVAALTTIAEGCAVVVENGDTWPSPLGARHSQEIARAALNARGGA